MTKAERQRIESFRKIGCCITGSPSYDVHHLTQGGRRLGHKFTIPLSPWLHRGVHNYGMSTAEMVEAYGPSLAHGKKPFEAFHGAEQELLAKVNERLAK